MKTPITPGTWLTPIPRLQYVLRVTRSDHDDGAIWIEYEKWGIKGPDNPTDKIPGLASVGDLISIGHGAWRDSYEWPHGRWKCCPLYYRAFPPRGHTGSLL